MTSPGAIDEETNEDAALDRILHLVEDGILSASEAEELIRALREP